MAGASNERRPFRSTFWTGWRRTATYFTILITVVTSLLVAALVASLNGTDENDDKASLAGETVIYRGSCDITTRTNLWIHLAINIISTGILASSNFFMQALSAPTRQEVDHAHRLGHWVEIGVHSIRNLRFISRRKLLVWFLFSLSSVPLHLIFNGCVLDSKATNGFTLLIVGEPFLVGGSFTVPAVTEEDQEYPSPPREGWNYTLYNHTAEDIYKSWSQHGNRRWERLDAFSDCMSRYNDVNAAMIHHRHVMMVIRGQNEASSTGWTREKVLKNTTGWKDIKSTNSLWGQYTFQRSGTGPRQNDYILSPYADRSGSTNKLNPTSGALFMDEGYYQPSFHKMQVHYCLSESFQAPCRLSVANSLLLVVCIMCAFKCLLCILTLGLDIWGDKDPLVTLGDAIASFITTPDSVTEGMCTLSSQNLGKVKMRALSADFVLLDDIRVWKTPPKRMAGQAVPRHIWILSYLLIGSSLAVSGFFFARANHVQSVTESRFAHDPVNPGVSGANIEQYKSLLVLTMIANTPQLILSMCYLAYDGLLTHMLGEFEWSSYGVSFKTLRVMSPSGQQRSTYRLQLPYRWSIPLLGVSVLLHWICSNCIYVSNYEYYDSDYPYGVLDTSRGLQMSLVAILIGLVISLSVALSPAILAMSRLPGHIVLGGSNSQVISAACHCVPISISHGMVASAERNSLLSRRGQLNALKTMATRELKWGEVSAGSVGNEVGHLAFGVEAQGITEPVDGKLYG